MYALDILQETKMIDYRPVDGPMDPNQKLMTKEGELLSDLKRYRRLVGKLIYLTITRYIYLLQWEWLASSCRLHVLAIGMLSFTF